MRTFRIFLHQQYLPPALHVVTACDEVMARAIAADMMEGSAAHVGVEVWFGWRRVFVRGAVPERRRSPHGRCGLRLSALPQWG